MENPFANFKTKLRTPIGLLSFAGGVLAFAFERFETANAVAGFLPIWLKFAANPAVPVVLVTGGIGLVFWEIHDIRKTEAEHVKKNLDTLVKESLVILGVLVVVIVVIIIGAVVGAKMERPKTTTAISKPSPPASTVDTSLPATNQSQPPAPAAKPVREPKQKPVTQQTNNPRPISPPPVTPVTGNSAASAPTTQSPNSSPDTVPTPGNPNYSAARERMFAEGTSKGIVMGDSPGATLDGTTCGYNTGTEIERSANAQITTDNYRNCSNGEILPTAHINTMHYAGNPDVNRLDTQQKEAWEEWKKKIIEHAGHKELVKSDCKELRTSLTTILASVPNLSKEQLNQLMAITDADLAQVLDVAEDKEKTLNLVSAGQLRSRQIQLPRPPS